MKKRFMTLAAVLCYAMTTTVANGTPMDYNAVVLAKLYTPNSEGGKDIKAALDAGENLKVISIN